LNTASNAVFAQKFLKVAMLKNCDDGEMNRFK
jgi:hypothetical protein